MLILEETVETSKVNFVIVFLQNSYRKEKNHHIRVRIKQSIQFF